MARLVPRLALALVGSGALFFLQMHAAKQCTDGKKKDIGMIISLITLMFWWTALACAISFAIAKKKREADLAANVVFEASKCTALSALLGLVFEATFCAFPVAEVLSVFLAASFTLTMMATPVALVWRAWRGE